MHGGRESHAAERNELPQRAPLLAKDLQRHSGREAALLKEPPDLAAFRLGQECGTTRKW